MAQVLPNIARANLETATCVVADCLCPISQEAFENHCSDERSRALVASLASSFPDARFQVDWASADDRRVVCGGRLTGTHAGDWRGIPATGRPVAATCVAIFGLVAGQLAALSLVIDSYAVAEQIGVIPLTDARHRGRAHPMEDS